MNTGSTISYFNVGSTISYYDKEYKRYYTVYCDHDGYLDGVGKMLFENYKDYDKVKKLVSFGGISFLGSEITPNPEKIHSSEHPQRNVCVFYTRDRGEMWEYNCPHVSQNLSGISSVFQEYNYLFEDGKWFVWSSNLTCGWDVLKKVLINNEIILDDNASKNNIQNSVDTSMKSDFVSKIHVVDGTKINLAKHLNDLGSIKYDAETDSFLIPVACSEGGIYKWDCEVINFFKNILDMCGLKAGSVQMTVLNNSEKFYVISNIESK